MATTVDAAMAVEPVPTSSTHPYTCLACSLAFTTAALQRSHYTTDLHRYNSKRRVAGLAPVTADVFEAKIFERQGAAAGRGGGEGAVEAVAEAQVNRRCDACGKSFASEGAEKSHLQSKKHRDMVFKGGAKALDSAINGSPEPPKAKRTPPATPSQQATAGPSTSQDPTLENDADALDKLIQLRLEAAPRIPALSCLFCTSTFPSLDDKVAHMLKFHGFFIPDREYLVDLEGLLDYLAEGVSVWNVCVFCSAGFGGNIEEAQDKEEQGEMAKRGLARVRKHMIDKSHCKLAWDTEAQRLEVSDYYDFRPSYPDYKKKSGKSKKADDGWEDVSDEEMADGEVDGDEVVMEGVSDSGSEGTLDDDDELPDRGISYGDSPFELVLPSGRRIGHRALRHVYKQNVVPYTLGGEVVGEGSRNSQLITRLALTAAAADPNKPSSSSVTAERLRLAAQRGSLASAALIPARGGLGAFGAGREVVKARNRGEAKEAGKHIKEHRDAQRKEAYKTRVGIKVGNNQKHYRDPLLQ